MNGPVETLLFDFGGTLDANGVAWKERFHALYRGEGVDMGGDAFAPVYYAADDPLVGTLPPATNLAETVHALVANLERELAGQHDWHCATSPESGADRPGRIATGFLTEANAAFDRNRPILKVLSDRYRLGIVSNFYGNLEAVCESAGLCSYFKVMVDSYCVGADKPDPAIFRSALERLDATPETTVLIGDSLRRDGEGAHRMGMSFIWIAPEHVLAGEQRSKVEYAVSDLRDLAKFL